LCKNGNTVIGKTTVTLDREKFKLVIRNVPTMICKDCSEGYLTEEISAQLLNLANETLKKGEGNYLRDFNKDNPT
jgi:YgiT-type zinc finger domain-containing protein